MHQCDCITVQKPQPINIGGACSIASADFNCTCQVLRCRCPIAFTTRGCGRAYQLPAAHNMTQHNIMTLWHTCKPGTLNALQELPSLRLLAWLLQSWLASRPGSLCPSARIVAGLAQQFVLRHGLVPRQYASLHQHLCLHRLVLVCAWARMHTHVTCRR